MPAEPSDAPHAADRSVPDPTAAALVLELADRIEAADGAPPLSDHARTRLTSPDVQHLLVRDAGGEVVGYAQRDGGELELLAATEDAALDLLRALTPDQDVALRVWSHGTRARLVPLFERLGFVRERELHQLRRPATLELPADPPLPGITVRPFVPGRDEQAWLAVNAAAFAHHPEQGRTSLTDLQALEAEPWFDPAGFLLAEGDGELLAFHWTKTHPDTGNGQPGEVYVLGVSPSAQGLGLGRALLVQGLRHLHALGCPYVLLYVDGDNAAARHLYDKDGFVGHDTDVQWRVH